MAENNTIVHEIIIRSIKIIDIGYITILYFTLAISISIIIEKILGKFTTTNAKEKTTLRLIAELSLHLWIITVLAYFARNIVELIPFSLDGIYGFDHQRVKELHDAGITFIFVIMFYQTNITEKLNYIHDRLTR
jgi:hypothetical protein